jgi:hypothetical protein
MYKREINLKGRRALFTAFALNIIPVNHLTEIEIIIKQNRMKPNGTDQEEDILRILGRSILCN